MSTVLCAFPKDLESKNKWLLLPALTSKLLWMKSSKLLTMDSNITQLFWTNSKKWTMLERTAGSTQKLRLKFNQNNVNITLIFYTCDGIKMRTVCLDISSSVSIILLSPFFSTILRHCLEGKYSTSAAEIHFFLIYTHIHAFKYEQSPQIPWEKKEGRFLEQVEHRRSHKTM